MDLFARYIFRQAAGAILLILVTLTVILWVATALKQIGLMTSQGQGMVLLLKITTLALPSLVAAIAPVALLIACIHTLNRLNGDSEIIVMTASGTQSWRFATPLMVLGLLVTVFIIFVNFYLQPKSLQLLRDYIVQVRTDLISQVLQPGRFSSAEKKLTFHIRDRDKNSDVLGLMVHDARNPDQIMTYLANRGRIIKSEGRDFLVMFTGHIQRRIKKRGRVQIIAFDQYLFDLSNIGEKKSKISYKPRESYLGELLNPDKTNFYFRASPGKFRSELHERFSSPLYPILFVLIILAQLGFARTTRESRTRAVIIAFSAAIGLRVAGIAAMNLLTLHSWAVFLIYGIPLTGILISLIIFQIRMSGLNLPKTRLGRALENLTERIVAYLSQRRIFRSLGLSPSKSEHS